MTKEKDHTLYLRIPEESFQKLKVHPQCVRLNGHQNALRLLIEMFLNGEIYLTVIGGNVDQSVGGPE